jgi:predicted nuclease with TOPRIM domain
MDNNIKTKEMPFLIKAGDSRVLLNGNPPQLDCRVLWEGRYQEMLSELSTLKQENERLDKHNKILYQDGDYLRKNLLAVIEENESLKKEVERSEEFARKLDDSLNGSLEKVLSLSFKISDLEKEVIEFAEWCSKNKWYYQPYFNGDMWLNDRVKTKRLTTDELHKMYQEQKK